MTIATPSALSAEELITLYETELYGESLPDDIFDRLSGDVILESGQKSVQELPDSMYLKLDAQANDAWKVNVAMTKDFSGDPVLGSDGDPRGHEEDHIVKNFMMEYTDECHVETNQAYGALAKAKAPYKLQETRVPKEGRWWKQYFGKQRRQMIFEGQSENLLEAPHFNDPMLHPIWFLPNLEDSEQPTYDTTYSTQVESVTEAMKDAGTGAAAAVGVEYLQRLEEFAFTKALIEPLDIDNGQGYVVILPSPQCRWLKNPINVQAMGGLFRDLSKFNEEDRMRYPGLIGDFQRLRIVEDQRYPTATIGGTATAGSYAGGNSMTIKYRGMGNADDGSSDPRDFSASARELGVLCGKRMLCETMPEKFHWEYEYIMYDKFFGSGIFCSFGGKLVQWNVGAAESPDATTLQHTGSIALAFAHPPLTGV